MKKLVSEELGRGNDPCHQSGLRILTELKTIGMLCSNKKLISFFTPEIVEAVPKPLPIPKYGEFGKSWKNIIPRRN